MNKILISLKNLFNNLNVIKKLSGNSKLCAVVKADAYGHGMKDISNIIANSVDYFAVSTIKEAMELRNNGIKNKILVLGYILPNKINEAIEFDLEITIGSLQQLNEIIKILKPKKQIKVHLKKDSGLHRYGYETFEALKEIIDFIKLNTNKISLVGFYTHFVICDDDCEKKICKQSKLFDKDVKFVKSEGFSPIVHAASSTTLFLTKKYQYDMVRIGMALYGYCSFDEPLKKVLSIESTIVDVKKLSNSFLGYGEKNRLNKSLKTAIVPIGYGYGISSKLSNNSCIYVRGIKCSIIGEMSMDCMYIDVTGISDVKLGDKVVFIGNFDTPNEISATSHAKTLNKYSCEVLSQINKIRFDIEMR